MKNRMLLEKFIFWAFTAIVLTGLGTAIYVMAPYMKDTLENDVVWIAVIVGLVILYILMNTLIAVFIYKDASKKSMNPWLWMLAVLYIPNFIGLLLYLIIRRQHHSHVGTEPGYKPVPCPHCGKLIQS